jgi:hypothetical protein
MPKAKLVVEEMARLLARLAQSIYFLRILIIDTVNFYAIFDCLI